MSTVKTKIFVTALSIVIFIVCCGVSLNVSGFALPFGWKVEDNNSVLTDLNIPDGYTAVCDRDLIERGFPFTAMMPYEDQSGCNDQYNLIAVIMDVLVAASLSIGISCLTVKAIVKK